MKFSPEVLTGVSIFFIIKEGQTMFKYEERLASLENKRNIIKKDSSCILVIPINLVRNLIIGGIPPSIRVRSKRFNTSKEFVRLL